MTTVSHWGGSAMTNISHWREGSVMTNGSHGGGGGGGGYPAMTNGSHVGGCHDK